MKCKKSCWFVITRILVSLLAGVISYFVAKCVFLQLTSPMLQRLTHLKLRGRLDELYSHYIPATSLMVAAATTLAVFLIAGVLVAIYSHDRKSPTKNIKANGEVIATIDDGGDTSFDGVSRIGVPLAAGAFFLYQIIGGSFFATTTVTAKATRCSNKILVVATLERGDNWLVDIPADEYHIGPIGADFDSEWHEAEFQRKKDGALRLAPKERTTTMFSVNAAPSGDTTITVAIDAYATYWPVASESFAKVIVPAASNEQDKKCPVPAADNETPK
jgi:hypothetical protein